MKRLKLIGGLVYDSMTQTIEKRDISVEGSVISADGTGAYEVDVSGCIVTPGLIDNHIHMFSGSRGGVNADMACLPNGVTTAVDAGTSGAASYPLFHQHDITRAGVRVKVYLNTASTGQISLVHGEHIDPEYVEADTIREMFRRYPHELVGLKLRHSIGVTEKGSDRALRTALDLAEELGCRVMVHVTNPAVPTGQIAAMLRPGDVFCHTYHGTGDTILDDNGKVGRAIWEARERGVLFDACNGNANFSFRTAIPAIRQGFLPDIISSDLTRSSLYQPYVFSLPYIMSKYLALGLPLEKVLDCATRAPAASLGLERELGSLAHGTIADLAVLKLEDQAISYQDSHGGSMQGGRFLLPVMTVKDGVIQYAQTNRIGSR